jgi:Calcineurin-like phosphoesterase
MSGSAASRHLCRWRTWSASAVVTLLAACAPSVSMLPADSNADPIRAAFVVLGENGVPVVRVITVASTCPALDVDGASQSMNVRAAPVIEALRPTVSAPALSKASAFPVLTCELRLTAATNRAAVGGRALPLPKRSPQRIVVIGDSGCRLKASDNVYQTCNDSNAWPFAQVIAAAAAAKPDLVIHVGDYHYRETACPSGNSGCAGSPWGYGWDAWDADLFTPARPLLAAAPWIMVRGNHESCNRAGQGWWRFLDPRPLVLGRDCNDVVNDSIGDFSDPYAIPFGADAQFIVFDSSKVGVAPLAITDLMYKIYMTQVRLAFEQGAGVAHNFFVNHHPILGFAPNPGQSPTGLYPGNGSLQSVLAPVSGERLFPSNFEALISGHVHLFEIVSYSTPQPTQLVSGNGGARADVALPRELPKGVTPSPGALIGSIVSTNQSGFMTIERGIDNSAWRIDAKDRKGQLFTTCALREAKTRCVPETLQ